MCIWTLEQTYTNTIELVVLILVLKQTKGSITQVPTTQHPRTPSSFPFTEVYVTERFCL